MKSLLPILCMAAVLGAMTAPLSAGPRRPLIDFTLVGEWPVAVPYGNLAVNGNFAYVTSFSPDLQIFDVSDPSHPVAAGQLHLPEALQTAAEVVVSGHYAYLRFYYNGDGGAGPPSGGFHVIDIRDPAHPVRTGSYLPSQTISALEIHDHYVCVAYYNRGPPGSSEIYAGFRVVDVSDPANPVAVGECPLGAGLTRGMAIANNRAYVTYADSLVVVDISNPLRPSVIGRYEFPAASGEVLLPFPADVAVAGNHAFVVTGHGLLLWGYEIGEAGLEVLDISDPARPTPAGRSHFGLGGVRVTVAGSHAFVVPVAHDPPRWMSYLGTEVHVFNVSDPAHPLRVDRGNFTMDYSGFAVAKDHLFIPSEGIFRIDKLSAASPALEMRRTRLTPVPELWVKCPGVDDFTLTTSSTLREWQSYTTIFSRLKEFKVVPDESGILKDPARFYGASSRMESPEEMSRKWKEARPANYRFRFERTDSGGPGVLSGIVEVEGELFDPSIHIFDAKLNGNPLADPDRHLFPTVEGLFALLNNTRSRSDLMIVKWDPTLHFPTWIHIDTNAGTVGDEVTIRITDLEEHLFVVVGPNQPR